MACRVGGKTAVVMRMSGVIEENGRSCGDLGAKRMEMQYDDLTWKSCWIRNVQVRDYVMRKSFEEKTFLDMGKRCWLRVVSAVRAGQSKGLRHPSMHTRQRS